MRKRRKEKIISKILFTIGILQSFVVGGFCGYLISNFLKENYMKQNDNSSIIKEAKVLQIAEGIAILDTNNNGILDHGDTAIIKRKLKNNSRTVVYLNKNPLAYSNEKGEYTILNKPSDYYKDSNSEYFDKKFSDFMKNKTILNIAKIKDK